MIRVFFLFSAVCAGRIFGNRYSGRSGTAEIVIVPPQGVFWSPKSCIYVPHTTFYIGNDKFWKRHYTKFSLAVRWMSHSDAKFDVEVNQIEDYVASKEIGSPVFEKASRKIQDTGAGNITLLFDPFENLYERSNDKEFLQRFPEIVTEVCITNKQNEEAKLFLETWTAYHEMDFDTALINTLRGEELFKAVGGISTHFVAEYFMANPDSKIPPYAIKAKIEENIHKETLNDEAVEDLEKFFQQIRPDGHYMLVMPSLEIIDDKLDEAAGLMKSNSEPHAKDVWFTKNIARTQLSMNISHLMAIIIVPMISVLSVKAFNYN